MVTAPLRENNVLGLMAGGGAMPRMVVENARKAGQQVVVLGLRGFADPELASIADKFYWCGVGRMGRAIRLFLREGAYRMILAGSVKKSDMYGRFRLFRLLPDLTTMRFWFFHLPDKRTDSILGKLAEMLEARGILMENCVKYLMDSMAKEGVLTRSQPSASQMRDIEFGWPVAKEMGRLDIGQSIAVKEQDVIAVEAIEGTDRMIVRAGELCRAGGWTLIKVSKPNQDMRFDVPTVGPDTIENLKKHGAKALVIEADKTFVVDYEAMVERAEKYGIVVVAHRNDDCE
ncbi:MAG TPA: UDP-2,3-diacylglucosamine diphosphatase LpxI [Phycisphaerae bacterium]|nr:UDP-2,3-diacylglucosamine diphosphatase LpxI [Phycisphaerae bacterium]